MMKEHSNKKQTYLKANNQLYSYYEHLDQTSELKEMQAFKSMLLKICDIKDRIEALSFPALGLSTLSTSSQCSKKEPENNKEDIQIQTDPEKSTVDAQVQTECGPNQLASIFYKESIIMEENIMAPIESTHISDIFIESSLSAIPIVQNLLDEQSLSIHQCGYKFEPKPTLFLNRFKADGLRFEYTGEEGQLSQVISKNAILTDRQTSIQFKIVHSVAFNIYIGLANASRLNKSHSALAKDGSTISFLASGKKKRFYVLNQWLQPTYLPVITNGDIIQMVVKYQQEEIQWLWQGVEMGTTKVNFRGENWHPFITLKCRGDVVQVL